MFSRCWQGKYNRKHSFKKLQKVILIHYFYFLFLLHNINHLNLDERDNVPLVYAQNMIDILTYLLLGASARKSSKDINEELCEEGELKIRDITNERRVKKKSSSMCLNSGGNGNNVESQSNISSQGRRKRSSAYTVTGSSNNLGPDSSSSQGRKNPTRASSPSPFDSR